MYVCGCVYVCACVRVCVRACVRAFMHSYYYSVFELYKEKENAYILLDMQIWSITVFPINSILQLLNIMGVACKHGLVVGEVLWATCSDG